MPSSMNWVDGAGGGTPLSAANLNQLAVVADIGATGTPTGDAVYAAVGAISVKPYGATGNGTTDDTTALQNAINSLDSTNGGSVWLPPGRYNFTSLSITGKNVTLDGPGILYNGTLNIGVQSGFAPVSLNTRVRVGFDRSSKSTTVNAINVANAHNLILEPHYANNYRALVNFPALSLGGSNTQHSARILLRGVRTPSWPDSTLQSIDYLVYVSPNTTGGIFSVGDLTVTGNPSVYCRVAHIAGGGLDGLVCTSNTFFFPGSAAADTTKTSHVDLSAAACDQLKIADNQLFEAGYESIKLLDPRSVSITGNEIIWPGQRDLKDAIAITLSGTGYARGAITGNTMQDYTKAAVAVYGTTGSDASGLTLGPNATLVETSNPHYYGVPSLPSPATQNRYYSDAAVVQPRVTDPTGSFYADNTQDSIGGFVTNGMVKYARQSEVTGRAGSFITTGSAVTVGTLSAVNGEKGLANSLPFYGGLLSVWVTDNAPNHGANYLLNVANTNSGRTVTVINVTGEQGAFSTSPHFTWSIDASDHLQATPVSPTTGTYWFYATTLGAVRLS